MNQLELDLRNAGDAAEASSYCYRRAEPGETCMFCDLGFGDGETVDALFGKPAHLKCVDELKAEFLEEHEDETVRAD